MKRFNSISNNRAFLLPVIMTVSLLLVALGMRPPAVPDQVKPKQHTRAVVEAQVKVAKIDQVKAQKYFSPVLVCRQPEIVAPAAFGTPIPLLAASVYHHTVIAQIPSRAPPVFDRA